MIRIQKLNQPNKHSGLALASGKSIEIKGVTIKNKNSFIIYVDEFTRKPWKPAKKSTKAKAVKKTATKKKELNGDAASL